MGACIVTDRDDRLAWQMANLGILAGGGFAEAICSYRIGRQQLYERFSVSAAPRDLRDRETSPNQS